MKIIASDFDGTVYFRTEDPPYKKEDVEAIKRFQAKGNLFGLCTGRPLMGIVPYASKDFDYDFYICNSGAMIYDRNYKPLLEKWVDLSVLHAVAKQFNEGVEIMIIAKDQMYVYHPLANSNFKNEVSSTQEIQSDQLFGFALHFNTANQAEEAIDEFRKNYPMIDAYVNVNAIDCVAKGSSKATGIEYIMDYYKINKDEISCIGDNYNDVPMLTAVENSYTFYNSPEGVKSQVKYLVNSVAECIESQL